MAVGWDLTKGTTGGNGFGWGNTLADLVTGPAPSRNNVDYRGQKVNSGQHAELGSPSDYPQPPALGGNGTTLGSTDWGAPSSSQGNLDWRARDRDDKYFNPGQGTGNWIPELALQLDEWANVDPESIFSNFYEGLKAYNTVGLESQRESANRLASLQAQLQKNSLQLAGGLSDTDRAKLYSMLKVDRDLYGTNSAEIQRTKEYLLRALGYRNERRDEQEGYYGDQRGFIRKALEQALAQSELDRAEGGRVLKVNKTGLRNNAAARGAYVSQGLEDSYSDEEGSFQNLINNLTLRDKGSRTDFERNQREIDEILQRIANEEKLDVLSWREQNAGLDTSKSRLDSEYERGNRNFMHGIDALNKKDAARQREEAIRNQLLAAQQQAANAQYLAAMQRAQQEAGMAALAAANGVNVQQMQFLSALDKHGAQQAANHAWSTGNTHIFNTIQRIQRERGWI